jgi:hypothetical protein
VFVGSSGSGSSLGGRFEVASETVLVLRRWLFTNIIPGMNAISGLIGTTDPEVAVFPRRAVGEVSPG